MTTEVGTDLHTRIREALEERIRLAKAAGPFWAPHRLVLTGQEEAHIRANDPASTIRRAEAGLRTLATYDRAKAYLDGLSDAAEAFEVERATTAEEVLAAAIRELAAGEGIEQ